MKTKKALAGLLGLLGSLTAFSFLVFFPAFVAAAPFFTESLANEKLTNMHKHISKIADLKRYVNEAHSSSAKINPFRGGKRWGKKIYKFRERKLT